MKEKNIGYVIFLTIVAALGGFLFGYDTAVISGTIEQVTLQYQLSSLQQGWYVGCALVGSMAGVLMAGYCGEKFGRKMSLFFSGSLFLLSGIGCAIAHTIDALVIYRIIGGVAIGMVSIISPMYISEIAIASYRGRLVAMYQLAITAGFLGAYLVNYQLLEYAVSGVAFENNTLQTVFVTEVWRAMLGMEALPALLFLLILFFIPESPRWLLLKNQQAKAVGILAKINASQLLAEEEAAVIQSKMAGQKSHTGYRVLLQSNYFKVVVIGVAIAILGQFMGVNAVLYYGPTIFKNSGLSEGDSLFYQVLVGLVNMLTTVLAIFIIDRVGRKMLVYWGVSGMIVCLALIGLYFWRGLAWSWPNEVLLFLFLSYVFCCAVSVSAVVFVLLSELYPNAIRAMAMSIAGFSLWVGTYLIGQLTPWMLEELTPHGTFWLFAAMCLPYMYIVWKHIPETAGKSLEEIEAMW
ncbi:sugar porter family MFS transporter [Flavihumibacter sp. CACIAM 22H1]|uniref:sugar porter family MFS transporter n=1 Tax=Flavihumibacter sp. CACIAM 22H1 TaxID=1812911 RepID=UPI0007A87755|nr:sugar porter family MFS transporter [Flavihumibacter sp. CACIAM 22H1]KYP15829.1 MAG: sugar:proton symporter [Flavihumibacter sp. CACIAM 22H1]